MLVWSMNKIKFAEIDRQINNNIDLGEIDRYIKILIFGEIDRQIIKSQRD